MGESTDKTEIFEYRLNNIEKTLVELKDLITESRIQQKQIDSLENENQQQEKRIRYLEEKITKLELQPIKDKAGKWQYIVDYVFKALVVICIGALFFKIGLGV